MPVSQHFLHATLDKMPIVDYVGITLVDEKPGFTGIYLRYPCGGLWPARTVVRDNPTHHDSVVNAWLAKPGVHEDKRA